MRLVYHPAGHDDDLGVALVELQAGRWRTARQLLLATATHWALRTSRTQLLAVAAARSDVVGVWLDEEPGSYDAQLMGARVAVERALRAHRQQHPQTLEFEFRARRDALLAARRALHDPVPWVCLLALAQIDTRQLRQEHRVDAGEPMLPSGPWGLLYEVNRRDPYNREAYHRVPPWPRSSTSVGPSPRSGPSDRHCCFCPRTRRSSSDGDRASIRCGGDSGRRSRRSTTR
ncbi:hypothetical protein [Streptomyces sp. NPDC006997]|uniref:hypothetical protein n=1 Tax=Streptomyces sp. NPDC006997 TaxID=3155356 RepID=UPI0033FCC1FD